MKSSISDELKTSCGKENGYENSEKRLAGLIGFASALAALFPAGMVHTAFADGYTFLNQTSTILELGNDTFDFTAGDFNKDGQMDLYALKKTQTGCGKTELHILSGSDNYQSFLLQTGLPLEIGDNFRFAVGDFNNDGVDDLYAIKKKNTNSLGRVFRVLKTGPFILWMTQESPSYGDHEERA